MAPRERKCFPTNIDGLCWLCTDDGSLTLWDARINETFHSGCGAVAESLVVYALYSGVSRRLGSRQTTSVLEYGFGTGTAFLLTAALAEHYQTNLNYHALEREILPGEFLASLDLPSSVQRCIDGGYAQVDTKHKPRRTDGTACSDPSQLNFFHAQFASLPGMIKELQLALNQFHSNEPGDVATQALGDDFGIYQFQLGNFVQLTLQVGNAAQFGLIDDKHPLTATRHDYFDAIYFDPFSPDTNPELWTMEVFRRAARALRCEGRLTSYCVKGAVRRLMSKAGLQVAKQPGPKGGKREVLVASRVE